MNNLEYWARGLAKGIREKAGAVLANDAVAAEPLASDLWSETSPQLEKALAAYDKREFGQLSERAWIRDSRRTCQKEIDDVTDAVILILGSSGASECREKIRTIEKAIEGSRGRIVRCQEQALAAPPQASLSTTGSIWTASRESIEELIDTEEFSIREMERQASRLREQFCNHLSQIGITVSMEEADSLLLTVQDDIVSMAAVTTHVAGLAIQLEELVEKSKEHPGHTIRYYGMYVLLVYAIDRIQNHFIDLINQTYIPMLRGFEKEADRNIAEARAQISLGGLREQLEANLVASRMTIQACQFMADVLDIQRKTIASENLVTRRTLAAAANTYRTVRLSHNVALLMGDCRKAFEAINQLQMPHLRPFQNLQLKEEMQRLAQRMTGKES